MLAFWYEGKVVKISQLSASTRLFNVIIEENNNGVFNFIPGQFVTMDLPVSEKRIHRWRSYSIANQPNMNNELEFCITKSEMGLGTKYLFEEVKEGSVLKFKGPEGGFVLPNNLDFEIIMICTGTGVAPFRSMLNYIKQENLPFNKINLIFGTRTNDSILFKNEFTEFAKENVNFEYDVALSRELSKSFHHGYVHDIYMTKYADKQIDRYFYICGWTGMIDQAVENLISKLGYERSQIKYELYG